MRMLRLQGKTALMWGLEGHDLECVQLLLRYDADTSAQDQQVCAGSCQHVSLKTFVTKCC